MAVHMLVGDIRLQDGRGTRVEALAWDGTSILAVGDRAAVRAAAGPAASAHDVGEATVLPGFIDAHHHPSIVALYAGVPRLAAPEVHDVASLQRVLAEAASHAPEGSWVVAMEWDELALAERRPPTRRELDDAVPDQPLFAMHYSGHRGLANSRALALAGLDRATPEPSGGTIERGAGGEPTGLLIERGMSPVERLARASRITSDAEGFLARLGAHHRALAAVGITRVVDATVPLDVFPLYREAAARGLLCVPTVVLPVSTSGYLEAPWDTLVDGALGDLPEPLSLGPVKLVFDGAPGCAMCLGWWQAFGAMVRSFGLALRTSSGDPLRTAFQLTPRVSGDLSVRTGILIYRREEAQKIVDAILERGLGVATHAIGNEAIEVAVRAYESAGAQLARPGVPIPRLEHASFLTQEMVSRIGAVGAAVVTQPYFASLPAYASAASIPKLRNAPLRWLLDAGVRVAGSSDYPVAGFAPLDGIRSAVRRLTSRGHAYEADQCISLDESVTLYTRGAAEVSGCLAECGSLEVGKRADLVVLSHALSEATLDAVTVRATVIGGEVVTGALDAVDAPTAAVRGEA
jgi:predicted amidohydrolase YtcJ